MSIKMIHNPEPRSRGFYCRIVKRGLDTILSIVGLAVVSPILIITAIAIKLDSKGSVFFRQERLGRDGKVFRILKFRSMCVGAEKSGSGVYSYKGDARVTRVGRFIRATSIDELPQLINVILGEMALIGPRPALTYHPWPLEQYTDHQLHMFDVLPGVTGWAQVHGRKEVPWPERIELSVWYVKNVSALVDLKILWMTFYKVISNANNNNTTVTGTSEND